MPTKRYRRSRMWAAPVSDAVIAYLHIGTLPGREADNWLDVFILTSPRDDTALRATWRAVRDELLADWIAESPGTRPWAWWQFDAPTWPLETMPERYRGGFWTSRLRAPRRRLGGRGTANHDALAYVPSFSFGLPDSGWLTTWEVAYYTGTARDIHGGPIGKEYRGHSFPHDVFDPSDPPRFESEAAYLDRHGLLTETERRRLPADAFEPERIEEPLAVTYD